MLPILFPNFVLPRNKRREFQDTKKVLKNPRKRLCKISTVKGSALTLPRVTLTVVLSYKFLPLAQTADKYFRAQLQIDCSAKQR